MAARSFYLEYRDQHSQKFWRGIQKGRFFVGHWGRIGSAGQFKLWTRNSERQAAADLAAKKQAKLEKGYVEVDDPMSPDDRLALLTTLFAEHPYELYWQTEPGQPVLADHLMQAVGETEACLAELGYPQGLQVRFHPDGDKGRAWLTEPGGTRIGFGYPPAEVVASWTTDDLRRNPDDYRSRDGWLGSDGLGTGVIETRRGWIDLSARIFLSRLVQSAGIRVVDTFDEPLTPVPALPVLGISFDWEEKAEALREATARLGWLPGQISAPGGVKMEINGQHLTLISDW